jgi:hypothetical protein
MDHCPASLNTRGSFELRESVVAVEGTDTVLWPPAAVQDLRAGGEQVLQF